MSKRSYGKARPEQASGDIYLKAAMISRAPVSVFFLDGEAIPFATIKAVYTYTLLLSVEGTGDVMVYKTALKKIMAAEGPDQHVVEFQAPLTPEAA